MVGGSGFGAAYWKADGSVVYLGNPAGFEEGPSYATDVSDDGSVIVGAAKGSPDGDASFVWNVVDGFTVLPDLPGGPVDGIAFVVSGDGTTVVGRSKSAAEETAYIWTEADGMRSLAQFFEEEYASGCPTGGIWRRRTTSRAMGL